ncbi:Aminomethyltransferase folate-binding domain-containing protein, partial [Lojkania enalia]
NNLAPSRPAPKGLTPLPSRRLICLSGADAAKFLQGLISNNVDPNRKSPFYAAFLDARGRVLWDVFIWTYPELIREEWVCYIEVDGAEVEALLKHLKKHKLRSKLQIKLVDEDEMGVYAAWGIGAEELQSSLLIASLEDPRATGFGFRCLYKGSLSKENAMPPIPALDAEQYTLRRYLFGIPEGPSEIPRESALPMETNIDLSSGIDFQKGCYVGQELTIRTKHTGVVRKRVLPVQLYRNGDPVPAEDTAPTFDPSWNDTIESGTDIKQLDEEGGIRKGRAAGKFLGGIGNVGLAVCRLEMMTSMRVSAEGGSWRPGAEFGIQGTENADGEPVRVKAFVPPW